MLITVKFFANAAIVMGKKEVQLVLNDGKEYTIGDIFDELSNVEGKDVKARLIGEGGKRQVGVRIVLNGLDIDFQDKMQTKVKDRDTVSIFPLIAGGCPLSLVGALGRLDKKRVVCLLGEVF